MVALALLVACTAPSSHRMASDAPQTARNPVALPWVAMWHPQPVRQALRAASRSRTTAPAKENSAYPSEAQWARLRQCENSGRYTSEPGDVYRGAYQFDHQTWRSVGGTGDPAETSPFEQDSRAKRLYGQRGWQPWPVCGRYLR